MQTVVQNIIDSHELSTSLKLVAGSKGTNRSIDAITIMEVEDYYKFDLNNFFLLTTFSFYKDCTNKIDELFLKLIDAGISGLAIKTDRFIQEIPPSVIAIANQHQIPLFHVTSSSRFYNIISQLILLLNKNLLKEANSINERYQKLYKAFLEGRNINYFIEKLSDYIDSPIICTDDGLNLLTNSKKQFNQDIFTTLAHLNPVNLSNSTYYDDLDMFIYVCKGYQGVVGYIIIETYQDFDEFEQVIIEQLATFMTMRLINSNITENFQRRERIKLIHEVLLYDSMPLEERILRLKSLNYHMNNCYQMIWFTINTSLNHSYVREMISETMSRSLDDHDYLFEQLESGFLLIVNHNPSNSQDYNFYPSLLNKTLEKITKSSNHSIGFSGFLNQQTPFPEVFDDIRQSIAISRKIFPNNNLIFLEDFSYFKFFFNSRDTSAYKQILNTIVNPLKLQDEQKDNVYWNTLKEAILSQTIQEAAENLFIHKTTVKYRLDKVSEYTGLDFYNPSDKVRLTHAFMIYTLEMVLQNSAV